jgi:hypothetical protein
LKLIWYYLLWFINDLIIKQRIIILQNVKNQKNTFILMDLK